MNEVKVEGKDVVRMACAIASKMDIPDEQKKTFAMSITNSIWPILCPDAGLFSEKDFHWPRE
ncbi:MAG: hypothetical protein LBG74_00255 [Spirochaetaceae bacterium]|nr:hypothetical protein [Spirochaetaceae bacterium]